MILRSSKDLPQLFRSSDALLTERSFLSSDRQCAALRGCLALHADLRDRGRAVVLGLSQEAPNVRRVRGP